MPHLLTLVRRGPSIGLEGAERWEATLSDDNLLDRMAQLSVGEPSDVGFGNLSVLEGMAGEALASQAALDE